MIKPILKIIYEYADYKKCRFCNQMYFNEAIYFKKKPICKNCLCFHLNFLYSSMMFRNVGTNIVIN